jgi:type I restriction enzyme, R subunit
MPSWVPSTSELDHSAGGTSPEVLMQDRLKKGKERLDQALESIELLCEPVQPPKGELEHIHYFCGNTEIPDDLKAHEAQRAALYKSTATLVRAYANICDDLLSAGYNEGERSMRTFSAAMAASPSKSVCICLYERYGYFS